MIFFKSKKRKEYERRQLEQFKDWLFQLPIGEQVPLGTIYNSKYYETDYNGNIKLRQEE